MMKKDVIYSMRMNKQVRDALKKVARKKHRTVASLLDKIISEYLETEGYIDLQGIKEERRKHARKKIMLPGKMFLQTDTQLQDLPSVILDLSAGGVLLTYPKGSAGVRVNSIEELPAFKLSFELPSTRESLSFNCSARHISVNGEEIKVGATFDNPDQRQLQSLNQYLM